LPGALTLQCLAELALHLVLGTVTLLVPGTVTLLVPGTVILRSSVIHAGLPPGQRQTQPGTCDTGVPPGRL
jgi:hypothetical protein